jgi:cytochrome b561/polyisoprenoid-binding protein YceI
VERAFHWAIALLIPTAIVLGVMAYDAPFDTDDALARKAFLFSFHKTVGLTIFFVALARIAWALSQPRPASLHATRKAETFLASLVHWLLYGSLILVPLLGWAHHATSEGFAPIWWPFGQDLPFLPKDPELSKTLGVLHITFERVLVAALLLHIVGTVKHVIVDKDSTFGRMWRGTDPGPLPAQASHRAPILAALVVWLAALGTGLALAPRGAEATASAVAEVGGEANWEVQEGSISITVSQLGNPVTGSFSDWAASIAFDEEVGADGTHGSVEASIGTGSLTLGSVTQQATGAEFLSSSEFPTAQVVAQLLPDGDAYIATGTITIRGTDVPLSLPFSLELDGNRARMRGIARLDRRDFGMGAAYPDESNVGFSVDVIVELLATRVDG